jgi:hypothetical protein
MKMLAFRELRIGELATSVHVAKPSTSICWKAKDCPATANIFDI